MREFVGTLRSNKIGGRRLPQLESCPWLAMTAPHTRTWTHSYENSKSNTPHNHKTTAFFPWGAHLLYEYLTCRPALRQSGSFARVTSSSRPRPARGPTRAARASRAEREPEGKGRGRTGPRAHVRASPRLSNLVAEVAEVGRALLLVGAVVLALRQHVEHHQVRRIVCQPLRRAHTRR